MRGFPSQLVLVTALASAMAVAVAAPRLGRAAVDDVEPPMLAERVRAGALPAIARRLPAHADGPGPGHASDGGPWLRPSGRLRHRS